MPSTLARQIRGGARLTLAACAPLLLSPAAHAAPPVSLRYTAPAACPSADAFRANLLARPSAANAAPPGDVRLEVVLSEAPSGFTGEIRVLSAGGGATTRRLEAPQCDEVEGALELVAAIALGLDARPAVRPATPPPSPPRESSPAPSPIAPRWRLGAALRGAVLTSVGPRVEFAPDLALQATFDARGLFAPSFELSGTWATSGDLSAPEGTATLTLWAGALTVCPLRFALGRFAARPCAEVSAGALVGSAKGPNVEGGSLTATRVALAPLARLEWALGDNVGLEAEGGADFEVSRDRFYFEPLGTSVFTSPVAGALGRLGVFVRWP